MQGQYNKSRLIELLFVLACGMPFNSYADSGSDIVEPLMIYEMDALTIPMESRQAVFLEFERAPKTTQLLKNNLAQYGYQFVENRALAKTKISIRGYVYFHDQDRHSPQVDLSEVLDKQINPESKIAFGETYYNSSDHPRDAFADATLLPTSPSVESVTAGVGVGWLAEKTGARDAINSAFYGAIDRIKSLCFTDCAERRILHQEVGLYLRFSDEKTTDHMSIIKVHITTKHDPVADTLIKEGVGRLMIRLAESNNTDAH